MLSQCPNPTVLSSGRHVFRDWALGKFSTKPQRLLQRLACQEEAGSKETEQTPPENPHWDQWTHFHQNLQLLEVRATSRKGQRLTEFSAL